MSTRNREPALDRYTQIGDLTAGVRRMLSNGLMWLLCGLLVLTFYLLFFGHDGAVGFGLMALGTIIALAVWKQNAVGLPIFPMLIAQHLVVYGLPIVVGHETISQYTDGDITRAGVELLIFLLALTAAWRVGMEVLHLSLPRAYAMRELTQDGMRGLGRIGFALIFGSTAHEVLQSVDLIYILYDLLPGGAYSIVTALLSALSACGFFIGAMLIGAGEARGFQTTGFWALLIVHCFLSASSFMLSSVIALVAAVCIGLLWGSRRIPWVYIACVLTVISLLNLGKFAMRERYWIGETTPQFTLTQMSAMYAEWFSTSFDILTSSQKPMTEGESQVAERTGQNLFDRINNLQNLLYVIQVIERDQIPPLRGATYTLIPPLLVPRIFWPNKPRTHEGQVLLNVHFGRQDRASSVRTYIAWGLLPEADGNFSPGIGAIFLGAVLGLLFAWVEKYTARKPVLSLEGFVAFAFFLGMAASYEMVASVLVTSVFQSILPLIVACAPFVQRAVIVRPPPPPEEE